MPFVASIGTYLPCWGMPPQRVAGDDEVVIGAEEVHDFFTGIELIGYEDRGSLPVKTGGGLTAKAHPPGVTGVAQIVEFFAQLRGEAANQVDGARIGLARDIGAPTAVYAATILDGPA